MIRGILIVQISILDWLTVLDKHALCTQSIYLLYVLDIVLSEYFLLVVQVINIQHVSSTQCNLHFHINSK
jgi:hypothetical protein